MAKNEAKVTFKADTDEFDAAIKKANSTIRELRSGVRLCDAQMDAAGVSVDALRRKEDLLGQENAQLNAKVSALSAKHREAIAAYGANSTEAQKLATQLNNARSAVARNEAAIKSNNTALESAIRAEQQADSALAKLTAEVARQEHEMGLLGQEYRELVLTQGRESAEVKQLEAQMTSLNRELQDNRSMLRRSDDAAEEFGLSLRGASEEAEASAQGFTVIKGVVSNLASSVFQRAADKARELAREVLNIGMGFETSMAKVQALSGATDAEYQALEQSARRYGATTRFTASQVADGFGYMALAGWNADSMLSGIPGVLNLAAAAEMDLAQASDIVTDYLTAFGLTAADSGMFVDQMTYAMAHSNTNIEQLGEAYKNCAATASSMHYSVEDTTAALMVMANAGVKGGEAGTALNAIMTRLATDTKGCATELAKYGVQVYDAQGNMNSLSEILQGMGGVWAKLTDEQQAAMAKTVAGVNHYSNLQTVMKGVSEEAAAGGQGFADYSAALKDCAGSAQQMSDIMMDTAQGDLYTMQSALEEVGLKVYEKVEAPFRSLIQFVSGPVASGLTSLIENARHIPPVLTGIAAGLAVLKARASDVGVLQRAHSRLSRAFDTSAVSCNRITRETVNGQAAFVKYNAATQTTTVLTGRSTAAIRIQQGALKAQALAMKAGAVAARGLGAALKTIAPMAVVSIGLELFAELTGNIEEAAERAERYDKATRGLTRAQSAFAPAAHEAARVSAEASDAAAQAAIAASDYAMSLDEVRGEVDGALDRNMALADSLKSIYEEAGAKVGSLGVYADTIGELAGQSELGADEVARLKLAVSKVNELCGTGYSVAKDEAGAYQLMADGAAVAADKVLALVEAQRLQIQQQAHAEAYAEAYKAHSANTKAAAEAQRTYNEKLDAYNALQERANAGEVVWAWEFRKASDELNNAKNSLDEANGTLGASKTAFEAAADSELLFQMASDGAADSVSRAVASNDTLIASLEGVGQSSLDFARDLESVGVSGEQLAGLTDEQAERLAVAYDGTFGSIKDLLSEFKIDIDGTKGAQMEALEAMGLSLQDFSSLSDSELQGLIDAYDGSLESVVATCVAKGYKIPGSLAGAIAANSGAPASSAGIVLDALVLKLTGGDAEKAAELLGRNIDEGIVNGLSEGGELPAEAAALMSEDVIARARETLGIQSPSTVFHEIGRYSAEGDANGISENAYLAADAAADMASGSVEAARLEAEAGMGSAGSTGVGSFISGILGRVGSVFGAGSSAAQNAVAGSRSGSGGASSAGSLLSELFGRGVSAGAGRLPLLGSKLARRATDGLDEGSAEAGRAGKGTADSYVRPIEAANARPAASRLSKGATDELSRGASKATSSGRFLVQGFISGMGSMLGGVISKARQIARAAINAIKDEGGEGSPWKETKPSGRFAVQGLIEGEESEVGALIDANRRIARTAVDAMTPEGLGIAWHKELPSLVPAVQPAAISSALASAMPSAAITHHIEARLDDGGVGERILASLDALGQRVTVLELDGEAVGRLLAPEIDATQGQRMAMEDWGLAQ